MKRPPPNIKVRLLLDSGAFGAWKRGISLDIGEYAEWMKERLHLVASYVNMDVIPGKNGLMVRTPEAVEDSAKKSYAALQDLKKRGLSPIPVFHQGERFYWLERLLDDGEDYVGISPYLKSHRNELAAWLAKAFAVVEKRRGWVRTHGFGMTSAHLILRHPWHTVDSTSWSIGAGYGQVLVPVFRDGKWDYSVPPVQITVSSAVSPTANRQFDAMGKFTRETIQLYMAEAGTDLTRVRNSSNARRMLFIYYYQQLQAFKNATAKHPVTIVFASTPNSSVQNRELNRANALDRLLSYFDLRDKPEGFVERYVTVGIPGTVDDVPRQNWRKESYMSFRRARLYERTTQDGDSAV